MRNWIAAAMLCVASSANAVSIATASLGLRFSYDQIWYDGWIDSDGMDFDTLPTTSTVSGAGSTSVSTADSIHPYGDVDYMREARREFTLTSSANSEGRASLTSGADWTYLGYLWTDDFGGTGAVVQAFVDLSVIGTGSATVSFDILFDGQDIYSGDPIVVQSTFSRTITAGTFSASPYLIAPIVSEYNVYWRNLRIEAIASDIPEPATWAMMIVGFGFVGLTQRRRKQMTS